MITEYTYGDISLQITTGTAPPLSWTTRLATRIRNTYYECPVCGQTFKTHSTLTQHLKTHLDLGFYNNTCPVCGRRFVKNLGLMVHLAKHGLKDPGHALYALVALRHTRVKAAMARFFRVDEEWETLGPYPIYSEAIA